MELKISKKLEIYLKRLWEIILLNYVKKCNCKISVLRKFNGELQFILKNSYKLSPDESILHQSYKYSLKFFSKLYLIKLCYLVR